MYGEYPGVKKILLAGFVLAAACQMVPSWAQAPDASAPVPGGMPMPGASQSGAPVPSAPVPGMQPTPGSQPNHRMSAYNQLPLNAGDAQARLDELKSLLPDARPQEIQEPIYQLCEWLQDMAEAHNRLAVSFSKNELTRAQAESERALAHKFSSLKNQAQLLKADLLIKQRRFPEALGPLVDIVVAEPRTPTGQKAYQRLKEIGFSEENENRTVVQPEQPKSPPAAPQAPVQNTAAPLVDAVPPLAPSRNQAASKSPAPTRTSAQAQPPANGKPQPPAPKTSKPAGPEPAAKSKGPLAQSQTKPRLIASRSLRRWIQGSPTGGM